jgi:hypothetical protein
VTPRQRREQNASDWKAQMATPDGRRVIWAILSRAGLFRSNYAVVPDPGVHLAIGEGERNVGLFVLDELNTHAPGAFARMLTEVQAKSTHSTDSAADTAEQ